MAYLSVILSSLLWSLAGQIFSYLGHKMTVAQLNLYKMGLAFILFVLTCLLLDIPMPLKNSLGWLTLSSFFGLYLADYFLFSSFTYLGPAKTQMIACLGPSTLAVMSYFFLADSLSFIDLLGLFFIAMAIVIMSLQTKAHSNHPLPWRFVIYAFLGTFFDAIGVFFSKMAFQNDPSLHPFSASLFRIFVSFLLLLLTFFVSKGSFQLRLSTQDKKWFVLATFCGTFLTLSLYNFALSQKNPAIVAALGSLAPIYSHLYETIRDKKPFTTSMIFSIFLMLLGIACSTHLVSLFL
jgi:drug/metabolite transporter (DMT)-like permease